jgi:hypothetical protein
MLENRPIYNWGLFNRGPQPASNLLVVTYTDNLYTILRIYYIDNA